MKTANSNGERILEMKEEMEMKMDEPTFVWETVLMYGSLLIMVMGIWMMGAWA